MKKKTEEKTSEQKAKQIKVSEETWRALKKEAAITDEKLGEIIERILNESYKNRNK